MKSETPFVELGDMLKSKALTSMPIDLQQDAGDDAQPAETGIRSEIDQMFEKVFTTFKSQLIGKQDLPKLSQVEILRDNTQLVGILDRKCVILDDSYGIVESSEFPNKLLSFAVSFDSQTLFFLSELNTIYIRSVEGLKELGNLEVEQPIQKLIFDRSSVLIGYGDEVIIQWHWGGKELEFIKKIDECIAVYDNVCINAKYILLVNPSTWRLMDFSGNDLAENMETDGEFKIAAFSPNIDTFAITEFTPDNTLWIYIYNTETYTADASNSLILEDESDLRVLGFTENSEFLYIFHDKKYLSVMNLDGECRKIQISRHNVYVTNVFINPENTYIHIITLRNVFINRFPVFYAGAVMTIEEEILQISEIEDTNEAVALNRTPSNSYAITVIDMSTKEKKLTYDLPDIRPFFLNYIKSSKYYCLGYVDQERLQIAELTFEDWRDVITLDCASYDNLFALFNHNESKIIIYNGIYVLVYTVGTYEFIIKIQPNSIVTAIAQIGREDQLAIADHISSIKIWDFRTDHLQKCKSQHEDVITCFDSTYDGRMLISGGKDAKIGIWSIWEKRIVMLLSAHEAPITSLLIVEGRKYLYSLCSEGKLILWCLKTRNKVYEKDMNGLTHLFITKDRKYFLLYDEQKLKISENLLATKEISIVGLETEKEAYKEYISSLKYAKNKPKFDPKFEKAIILPYMLTTLQIYTYLNLHEYLLKSLKVKSQLFNTVAGENALTIAAKKKFVDCIRCIIKYLIKYTDLKQNPYALRIINLKTLVAVNSIKLSIIPKLYDILMKQSTNTALPRSTSKWSSIPQYSLTYEMESCVNFFALVEPSDNDLMEIVFWESLVKINFTIGSKQSMKFLNSLLNSENPDIMRCQFVCFILEYKWEKLKWVMVVQAIFFAVYLIFLLLYTMILHHSNDDDIIQDLMLIPPFCIAVLLQISEFFEIRSNLKVYFSNTRNLLDILRLILFFIYCISIWRGTQESDLKGLYVLVLLISMIKGISYFRIFDLTRYLINLISEVAIDMIPFMIIVAYTTLCSAFLFYFIASDDRNLTEFLISAYTLNLGDFDVGEYGELEWIVFIAATIINPILMLNMLIAIMGGTFARVDEKSDIADKLELTEMILEIESLYYSNKDTGWDQYLHVCSSATGQFREKDVFSKLSSLNKLSKKHKRSINQKLDDIISKLSSQESEIEGLKNLLQEQQGASVVSSTHSNQQPSMEQSEEEAEAYGDEQIPSGEALDK